MKTKIFFFTFLFFFCQNTFSYESLDSFLSSNEAKTCIIASDGCNSFIMKNGQIYGSTSMFCSNYKVNWKCNSHKATFDIKKIVDTNLIDKKLEEFQNGDFQTNSSNNKTQKQLEYEEKLKSQMGEKYKKIGDNFIKKYKKILLKYSEFKRNQINKTVIKKIDKKIKSIKKLKISKLKKNKFIALLNYLKFKIENLGV